MHPNGALLQRLFTALNEHDHAAMGFCYHKTEKVLFHDIAFHLVEAKHILAMWHMICLTDIRASFRVVDSTTTSARVKLIDDYTFSATGRRVRNEIESQFRLSDGLIVEHVDDCDAHLWAAMAFGRVIGFLPGRLRLLRSLKGRSLLRAFIDEHPQYREDVTV